MIIAGDVPREEVAMTAVEDLADLAHRAAQAELLVRSASWQERASVEKLILSATSALEDERALVRRGDTLPADASPRWQQRLSELSNPPPSTEAAINADAIAATTIARIALCEAELAALRARLASIDEDATSATDSPVRSYITNPVVTNARALRHATADEMRHIARDRPRRVAVKLAISLGFGLAYLGFLRLFQWDLKEKELPYLALYALSGVMGSVVCVNAMSMDAGRVRRALASGTRLWHLLIAKNLAILIIVGAAGILLSLLLAWRAKDSTALIKACGQLFTMILLWLGIGNVMSIALPLRKEPLREHQRDGTLRRFLLSFVISYGVSLVVNLMLYWRIWAKRTLLEQVTGPWLPVLLIVASAALSWVLFTVLAVGLAEQPRFRRILLRELVEYSEEKISGLEA